MNHPHELKIAELEKQLTLKSRELEIEAALEKVRSSALAMKEPSDMVEVCRIISDQLQPLGLNGIRNVQTAIFYETKKTYINFEYYTKHNKSLITEVDYRTHELQELFASKMIKGVEELFSETLKSKEVKDWYAYQKTTNQFADTFLETAESLSYYWYSLGPVALGISTYVPLNEQEINLFKRFRNVFELAYRRFIDIEQAMAQAREAKIEAALERVRSNAMAMQNSEDLAIAVATVFEQLDKLNLGTLRCGIAINNKQKRSADVWITTLSDHGKTVQVSGVDSMDIHPLLKGAFDAWLQQEDFSYLLQGEDLNRYYKALIKVNYKLPDSQSIFSETEDLKQYCYVATFQAGGLFAFRETVFPDEAKMLMKRFADVFNFTYTRFTDLKQAEAQTKEAKIELALERVRARTMAMQKSDELKEVVVNIFEGMSKLGFDPAVCNIALINNETYDFDVWTAHHTDEGVFTYKVRIPYFNHPFREQLLESFRQEISFNTHELSGELKKSYDQLFIKYVDISNVPDDVKLLITELPEIESLVLSAAYIKQGLLIMSRTTPATKYESDLLQRFAKVFEQTYTRFLDLQNAEAQAREAQIEAALERVRSRTMGMQKSEELKEVIQVVYEQFVHLNINIEHTGFVMDYKARDDYNIWIADKLGTPSQITIPYFDCVYYNRFNEAKEKGMDFFAVNLTFEEKNRFYQELFKNVSGLPEEALEFLLSCPGLAASTVLLENVCLYIENFSGTPYTDEENTTLMRFGKVFQQTYTRFLDLQKAEAQAREATIEASLEKVRGKALGMHTSDDISETMGVVFAELPKLGISSLRCGVGLLSKDSRDVVFYAAANALESNSLTLIGTGEMSGHPEFENQYECWLKQRNYFVTLSNEALRSYYEALVARLSAPYTPREHKEQTEYGYYFPFSEGMFYAWDEKPYLENEINILNRFKAIIDLTFRRYLDLQKAEAQAREAQIELALERVRARTMAMHNSEELSEASFVLFNQLKELGEMAAQISIGIYNEKEMEMELYATIYGNQWNETGRIPYDKNIVQRKIYATWKEQKKSIIIDLSGEELNDFNKFKMEYSSQYKSENELPQNRWVIHIAFFSKGVLFFSTTEPHPQETIHLLERFAGVFDLTYTRFLDLKNAEAQAREAQIELGLERVRARTMAMQRSEELSEAAYVLFQQFQELGQEPEQFTIGIINEADRVIEFWHTWLGSPMEAKVIMSIDEPHVANKIYTLWKEQNKTAIIDLSGKDLREYNVYRKKRLKEANVDLGTVLDEEQRRIIYIAIFSKGTISISTHEPRPAETIQLLERFAGVFDLTYTRFLDLKNAEAQAREAKIEASLERTRSKAMSMYSSEDLSATVNIFFKELKTLGIIPIRCGVGQIDEESRTTSLTTTTSSQQGDSFEVVGKIKQTGHPVLDGIFDHWKLQKEYHPVLEGEDIKAYYRVMNSQIAYPDYLEDVTQYGNSFYFKEGFVFAWTENKLSEEELEIFRRFTSVLSLTYRRYMDLKDAELRALEAVRQSSLDRVRAEIASMRTAEDLNHITPVIWRELKTLDVPFIRCGVYIVDEVNTKVQVYLTTPDGKSLAVLNLNFNANELTSNSVQYWRKKNIYTEHWTKKQFITWTKSMIEQGQIQNAETYQGSADPPESLDLYFVPFTQGMLYVGNTSPLTEEKLQIVTSLAEAFSIAYARYEDFKNIEEAKNRTEVTLNELKSAQALLIHSEKMASLGELTAGIAHEIKNPLNFVNNFSEVSRELLDEMKTELQNKNLEEVIEIIEDLTQNLEKINQHGKRADSIVKGMLLHSRGTSGEKVLTNINDLLDQYVTLAYHGLRAQNKEFNITIEKIYDKSIDKVTVVPQDISRVFLNLINNACYAAYEKKKMRENNFSPTLNVSTKNLQNKVEIRIRDNGNGIPQSIREQIFNPFFTTKPTGEGTGLGLSISYDIVTKAHGGEIKFESEEGKYTEFRIIIPK